MTEAPPGFVEPGFASRLVARFVDAVLIFAVFALADVVGGANVATVVAVAVTASYEILLVAHRGQTLGKIALRIRVIDGQDGGIGTILSVAVIVPVLAGPLHRGVHDRFGRTVVTAVR